MEEEIPELSGLLQQVVAAGVPVQKDMITAVAECALRHVNKYKKASGAWPGLFLSYDGSFRPLTHPPKQQPNTTQQPAIPCLHQAVYLIERWIRHVDPPFRSAGICIIDKLCHEVRGVCMCMLYRGVGRTEDS